MPYKQLIERINAWPGNVDGCDMLAPNPIGFGKDDEWG